MGTIKRAFTIIELLIVLAIMAILIGILVPMVDRSLSANRLATDVEVLRAKIEETRLLSGSTRASDESIGIEEPGKDLVGYYGVFLPARENQLSKQYYAIVRLSSPLNTTGTGYCSPTLAVQHARAGIGDCLVEKIELSGNVLFEDGTINVNRIIGFKAPTQQLVDLYCPRPCGGSNIWQENPNGPVFDVQAGNDLRLSYRNKKAKVDIEEFTAKLLVDYD